MMSLLLTNLPIRLGGGSNYSVLLGDSASPLASFFSSWWVLILLLTLSTGFVFVWLFLYRKKLQVRIWEIVLVSVAHTIVGVLLVKFFALLEAGFDTTKAGNLSLYGGIFFMPLFYLGFAKAKKVSISLAFDIFTPCLTCTLMLARFNCLVHGCCQGVLMSNGKHFPTPLMEILFQSVFLLALIWLFVSQKGKGILYPLYMVGYGVFRFIIEWFREYNGSAVLHFGHIWSIVSVVLGITWIVAYVLLDRRNQKRGIEYEA